MSRKSYPNVNAANQYARDVVRGKIVACQFVIQACQRHLDDLMAEKVSRFVTASTRTWLNGPPNLFSCCRTPRVSGHLRGCPSRWSRGSSL
ncbi:bacteriophage V large terminase subunit domain protein [Escherichia coli STEC_DG131-3]|nr:bacteriophage V large terminase subunit domain protein [Escherichia coli STEC_DG131-3]